MNASVFFFEDTCAAVLHGLLTSVTAFEDWFAVLNRLLAIGVLFVSVDASVFFFEDRCAAVLHGPLTSVTAFEDWFAVLNRLVAIGVLFVSGSPAVSCLLYLMATPA